ncbi:hypothetical protein [Microcoleus sp. Pol11C2]|uniref:hypothetical protein n=1 Tax=Microcoleus sp. Pol11C2 TaxID=3055389 RepID=UPI0040409D26
MTATIIISKNADPNLEPKSPSQLENIPKIFPESQQKKVIFLDEFLVKPPDRMQWVDGNLVEKTGITFKHSLAQSKLVRY